MRESQAQRWLLALSIGCLICGALSLLFVGADVVGILQGVTPAGGFACGIVGMILGHASRRASSGGGDTARATVGLMLSYASIAALLSLAVLALSHQPSQLFPPGN